MGDLGYDELIKQVQRYEDRVNELQERIRQLEKIEKTLHRKTKAALQETEYFLQESQRIANIGSYITNFRKGMWKSSKALDDIFGIGENYDRSVKGWLQIIHPEQREEMNEYLNRHVIAERKKFDKEYRILRINDKAERWVHGIGEVEFDDSGNLIQMIGTIQDITERKLAEDAFRAKSEEIDRFFSLSLELLCIADSDGYFRRLNAEWEKILGYRSEDLVGRKYLDFVHPDDVDATRAVASAMAHGKEAVNFINRYRHKNGTYRWIEWRSAPYENNLSYAAARDITERKLAEEALQSANDKLRATLEALPDLMFEVDAAGVIYDCVAPHPEQFYLPPEKFLGKSALDLLPKSVAGIVKSAIAEAVEKGSHHGAIYSLPESDGQHWYELSISSKGDGKLKGGRFIVLARDITKRKRAEEEVERVFALSPDLLCVAAPDGRFVKINPQWENVLGFTTEEIMKAGYAALIHPDDIESTVAEVRRQLAGAETINFVNRYKCKDGSYKLLEWQATPAEGGLLYAAARDITERKQAEEALRESEAKYKSLIENSVLGIGVSQGNRIIFANRALQKIFGYDSNEDLIKTPLLDHVHPSSKQLVLDRLERIGKGEKLPASFIYKIIRKDGSVRTIEAASSSTVLNGQEYRQTTFKDITEQQKVEAALKESEEKYRTLIESSDDPVSVLDEDLNILYANESYLSRHGLKPETIAYTNYRLLHSLESTIELSEKMAEVFRTLKSISYVHQSSKDKKVFLRTLNPTIIGGVVSSVIIYSKDITEIKRAAEEIKNLAKFPAENPDPVLRVSKDGILLYANAAALHAEKKLQAGNRIEESLWEIVSEAYERNIRMVREFKFENKTYSLLIVPFQENGYLNLYGRDVTEIRKAEEEKKKLEEQLFQAQKMESIGRLAGGIAHDFNNILTGIMGYAELLQIQFESELSLEKKQAIDIIIKGAERAADLTQQLLGFARGGKYNPMPLQINDVIREAVRVSEKIFEKNVEVLYRLDENVSAIEADKNQMHQVLTNIIINARDAMPAGGKLLFSTANLLVDKYYILVHPEFKTGNYVKISITDTGIGMPKEVKNRIFEPFFTTKGAGKGTGLGLATAYGIIKNHNGYIHVYSEPGIGTTFTICLPVSGCAVIEDQKETKVIRGDETILIVDDEENVRNIVTKQLESLGYKVLTAADGKEAMSIFEQKADAIDIVLLDMIMPNMGGKETFRGIKKMKPNTTIILVSGFSQDDKASEVLKEGASGFIQKPFKLYDLSNAIDQALRGK